MLYPHNGDRDRRFYGVTSAYMYSRHTIALFSLLLQSSQSVDAKSVSHRRRRRPRKFLDTPPATSSIAPTNSICRRLRGTARAPTRFACQSSASPAPPPSLRHRRRRSISSCTGCVRRLSEARPRLQWDGTSRARVSARFWLGGSMPPCRLRRRKFCHPHSHPPFRKLHVFAF